MATVRAVIRRSHLKSKTGCLDCKRRRVKCDEFKPNCRQCHRQGIECHYPARRQRLEQLLWPADIEQACVRWQKSGRPPFPTLALADSPSWHNIPLFTLRYIYQMALIDSMLRLSGTSYMALVWGEMNIVIQLVVQFDFVANAVAAFSAERLAVRLKSSEAARDAARHRNLAIQGLIQAFDNLSEETSDAVLASYICCQDIVSEYHSFMMITKRFSKLMPQMHQWLGNSPFRRIYTYELLLDSHQSFSAYLSSLSTHKANAIPPTLSVKDVLHEGIDSLNGHLPCFWNDQNFAAAIRQQRDAMMYVYERLQVQQVPAVAQYRQMYPFLSWFNRSTGSSYIALSQRDPLSMLFFVHFYAVVLVLAVAWPATDAPFFASFRARAILDLAKALGGEQGLMCQGCHKTHDYMQIMSFPLHAVRLYQQHKMRSESSRRLFPTWLSLTREIIGSVGEFDHTTNGQQILAM